MNKYILILITLSFLSLLLSCNNSTRLPEREVVSLPILDSVGADVPWTTYEAEGLTGGMSIISSRDWGDLSSEASGREAVRLSLEGDSIELTLTKKADSFVIRYAVPDSVDGSPYVCGLSIYVDDIYIKDAELTNKFTWNYGTWNTEGGTIRWSNNPLVKPSNPHHFFDETQISLNEPAEAGSVIRLQRDTINAEFVNTDWIVIDLIEAELRGAPKEIPAGWINLVDLGAIPNDGIDDTEAITSALELAQSNESGVWIPIGEFNFDKGTRGAGWNGNGTRIYSSGVSIAGAGEWYTTLKGEFAGIYLLEGGVEIRNLKIETQEIIRDDNLGVCGIEGDLSDSTISNVWLTHSKAGIWVTSAFGRSNIPSGVTIQNSRIRNVWADGLNFHYGTSESLVENCSIRNTGDDGLAMWSDTNINQGNSFINNTIQLPLLANGIAIYGGMNTTVTGNLIMDIVDNGAGISIGTDFSPPTITGDLNIYGNYLIRCGSWHHDWRIGIGALWLHWPNSRGRVNTPKVNIKSNIISDSTWQGLYMDGDSQNSIITIENNLIEDPASWGVQIAHGAKGELSMKDNTITGSQKGYLYNPSQVILNLTGNNW